ncbi:cAMP-regulated phosphoprotein 21 isoform X1, partial [Lates japonicus]
MDDDVAGTTLPASRPSRANDRVTPFPGRPAASAAPSSKLVGSTSNPSHAAGPSPETDCYFPLTSEESTKRGTVEKANTGGERIIAFLAALWEHGIYDLIIHLRMTEVARKCRCPPKTLSFDARYQLPSSAMSAPCNQRENESLQHDTSPDTNISSSSLDNERTSCKEEEQERSTDPKKHSLSK